MDSVQRIDEEGRDAIDVQSRRAADSTLRLHLPIPVRIGGSWERVAGDTAKFCKLRGCLKTVTVVFCEVHLGTTSGTRIKRKRVILAYMCVKLLVR